MGITATPASAEWREASSDHFLIYANSGEAWLRNFAERLEKFDSAMRLLRRMPDRPDQRSNRVIIYAVQGFDAVQRLCGRCGSVAGFYIPRVGGSIIYTARTTAANSWDMNSDIVLFHEYSHHHMLENFASAYPSWFIEGFAEFNSTATFERDGGVSIGRPAQHRAYGLRILPKLSVEKLFERPAKLNEDEIEVFYGRAWLLTHYLTFTPARDGQLTRYLAAISDGKPSLDAARAAFGDLKTLNRELDQAISGRFRYLTIGPERLKTGRIVVRPLTAGEASTIGVRMRSDRGVNHQEALAIVPEARRRAAAFANDPGAQEVLAEAEYDAGNDAEADAAADRALAVDPKRLQALLYKGRVAMRRAEAAKDGGDAGWRAARGWFVKANRADPDAAEPLMLNYLSYEAQGVPPSGNAVPGLMRALELSPQDNGLRMIAARQLLLDDQPRDARRLLLPLAYDPHQRGEAKFAARLVAMIDKGVAARDIARAGPQTDEKDAADTPSAPDAPR